MAQFQPVRIPGMQRSRQLNFGAPDRWHRVSQIDVVDDMVMSPIRQIPVFAIISTWFDADIIGASVAHHLRQGVTGVLILDNASPDITVATAVSSGATLAHRYETQFYDDDYRIRLENELARDLVEKYGECWILSLDADEFVHGVGSPSVSMNLAETLHHMPDAVDVVGSYCFDLYPSKESPYVIGDHPAKHMSHGMQRLEYYCPRRHWKHVAIRYRSTDFDIAQTRGNHIPATSAKRAVTESEFSLPILHAPYRRREDSEARLRALCDKSEGVAGHSRSAGDDQHTGSQGAIKRWQALESVYAGDIKNILVPHTQVYGRDIRGLWLYPWRRFYPWIENQLE